MIKNFALRLLGIFKLKMILICVIVSGIISLLNYNYMLSQYRDNSVTSGFDLFTYYYFARNFKSVDSQLNILCYTFLMAPFIIVLFANTIFLHDYMLNSIYFSISRIKSKSWWHFMHMFIVCFSTPVYFLFYNLSFYIFSCLLTSFNPASLYNAINLKYLLSSSEALLFVVQFSFVQGVIFLLIILVQYGVTCFFGSLNGLLSAAIPTGLIILAAIFLRYRLPLFNKLILDRNQLNNTNPSILNLVLLFGSFVLAFLLIDKIYRKWDIKILS